MNLPAMEPDLAASPPNKTKTSRLAIASLVCAIAGALPRLLAYWTGELESVILCFLAAGLVSLVGLVLGILAVTRIRRSKGQLIGKSLAVAAIEVSGIVLLLVLTPLALSYVGRP